MTSANGTMTADTARDRFGDAIDGTLPAEERRAFEAALEADEALREEFESYRAIVRGVSAIAPRVAGAEPGPETDAGGAAAEPAPSLVPKVQERLRRRSKGRFFRDRFSSGEVRSGGLTAMLVVASLLLVVAIWLMLDNVELLSP